MQNYENFDNWRKALSETIHKSGKSVKQIACALWPLKKVEVAHNALLEVMDKGKNRKLTIDEVAFISKFCGRYDILYYFSYITDHEIPLMKSNKEKRLIRKKKAEKVLDAISEFIETFE